MALVYKAIAALLYCSSLGWKQKGGFAVTRRIEAAPESWDCVRKLSDATPDGRVEVGPKEDLLAPLDVINMVSQVRQDYNPHDLAELRQAMIVEDDDGEKRIQLIQPITVGYFHRTDLKKYLTKLNATWGTKHTIDEQVPLPGSHGRYYLLVVAGHRRTITIRQAAEEIGVNPSRVDVVFHVLDGTELTFREGIKTQYRENFHKRPESWEDAVAITAILSEGVRSGEYKTFADCARDLGIPPERVSKAFRFSELPQAVQGRVEKGALGYGAALEIHQIAVAKAHNLARGRYAAEEMKEFLFKFKNGTALLSDAWGHLTSDERKDWKETVLNHADNVSELRTMRDVRQYAKDECNDYVWQEQLSLVQESESVALKKAQRRSVTAVRRILRNALGDIVSQLDSEIDRIDNGEESQVDWSPDLLVRIDQVREGLEVLSERTHEVSVSELREQVVTAIAAGRLAIIDLLDEAQATDVMGDAITEAAGQEEALFA